LEVNKQKVIIGITGCNRKYYSRALLESIKIFKKDYKEKIDARVVYVDNGSEEIGLKKMLEDYKSDDTINDLIFRKERDPSRDEWHGKNKILEMCNLEDEIPIIFFQDDTQIVNTHSLYNLVVDFTYMDIPHMSISGVRRITTNQKAAIDNQKLKSSVTGDIYWFNRDLHLGTTGIYKSSLFKKIGNYKIDIDEKTYDGFTSCEDYMDTLSKEKGDFKYSLWPHVPCSIGIWNDPRGLHALVRGDRRYGFYNPPDKKSGLYYEMLSSDDHENLLNSDIPASFSELAKPIGWDYRKDASGDMYKYDKIKIRQEGPATNFKNETIEDYKPSDQKKEDFNFIRF